MTLKTGQDTWTDERIETTVTIQFAYSHLGEAAQEVVPECANSLRYTYAQRIVSKTKRLFLILIDLGVPEQIFRLIDEYYDDDFLPFTEDEVSSLRLSRNGGRALDQLFFRQQFKYMVRVLREGEHIRYAEVEFVPIQPIEQKSISTVSEHEAVQLPTPVNRVLVRREFSLKRKQKELDLLSEIAGAKPLSHEHVLSIFGSYTQHDRMFVLLAPVTKHVLKSFLSDTPKAFEALPKYERRKHLLTWPHCLANALAWLHHHGAYHGAVRPSRICIDEYHQISLGQFEGDWLLGTPTSRDDLESYQYAAPEFWKRGLTVKNAGSGSAFSSGRSAAGRLPPPRSHGSSARESGHEDPSITDRSHSMQSEDSGYAFVPAFRGNHSRLKLTAYNSLSSDQPAQIRNFESRLNQRNEEIHLADRPRRTLSRRLDNLSVRSSNSSELGRQSAIPRKPIYDLSGDTKTTMVQTWKSSARDQTAADIFGLAAVTMDILTVMCGRTVSAFAKHRSKKNTQAGRGGGLADASFHANLSQVASWAETLLKDSEKKMKKEGNGLFRAIGPILENTIQCFDREPGNRMRASALSATIHKHLSSSAGITYPHCALRVPDDRQSEIRKEKIRAASRLDSRVLDPEHSLADQQSRVAQQTHAGSLSNTSRVMNDDYEEQYFTVQSAHGRATSTIQLPPADPNHRIYTEPRQDEESLSETMFDYYERQWVGPTASRNTRIQALPPRIRLDEDIDEQNEDENDKPQDTLYPLCTTSSKARNYSYGPNIPSLLSHRPELPGTIPLFPPSLDYKPPNRDLPALPTTPNTKKSRNAVKLPLAPGSADVNQATHVLAQTIGGFKSRYSRV
ncbi:hypothetical protein LTS08_004515 [Lithohypha guttulata]|nr:hypothetical protein LTS08_004515 [Lithohypha guttulata]